MAWLDFQHKICCRACGNSGTKSRLLHAVSCKTAMYHRVYFVPNLVCSNNNSWVGHLVYKVFKICLLLFLRVLLKLMFSEKVTKFEQISNIFFDNNSGGGVQKDTRVFF